MGMTIAPLFDRVRRWGRGMKSAPQNRLSDTLWRDTISALPFLARLDASELARLRELAGHFLATKEFAAAGGLQLTDAICASIAVQGCLPILNLGLGCYRDWIGIVVYPDEFVIPRTIEDEFGVTHEYNDIASGEAWEGGPLLVSWLDAQMTGEGYNVVIHEFAHKLDMRNGEANGIPPLPADISREEWKNTLRAAYDDFCDRVEQNNEALEIDPYAAEHPSEFFAVLTEIFFELPDLLHREYLALYTLFNRFYQQDPLRRATPPPGTGGYQSGH